MASETNDDWDEPLAFSDSLVESEGEEEALDERIRNENNKKLQEYVQKMAYRPTPPPPTRPRSNLLAEPKKVFLVDAYATFGDVMDPRVRTQRLKRMTGKYTAINTDQLEKIIKNQKSKERKKEELLKRKQEVYYEMLTKLENQCRTQYLNVLIKKFSNFIAKLATTMRIPPTLVEPYSRMQRGIFCNILLAIGLQPQNEAAIYYTSQEALKYEVCHKLAHALLSLIIKALDSASTKNPEDIPPLDTDFIMDNYIKDRLMCAAEKKLLNARTQFIKPPPNAIEKCKNF